MFNYWCHMEVVGKCRTERMKNALRYEQEYDFVKQKEENVRAVCCHLQRCDDGIFSRNLKSDLDEENSSKKQDVKKCFNSLRTELSTAVEIANQIYENSDTDSSIRKVKVSTGTLKLTEATIKKVDGMTKFSRDTSYHFGSSHEKESFSLKPKAYQADNGEAKKIMLKLIIFFALTATFFGVYHWGFFQPFAEELKEGLYILNWNDLEKTFSRQSLVKSREYLLDLKSENPVTLAQTLETLSSLQFIGKQPF